MTDKKNAEEAGRRFTELVGILDRLRGVDGCPWDREQDENTIVNYFLEEVYEAVEALGDGKTEALAEELGDVLMEVVFLARIFKERKAFTISRVLAGINDKMVRRHPHVFGDKSYESSESVKEAWARQKKAEKNRRSVFDGLVRRAPALLTAFQIGERASSFGFDWPDAESAFAKIGEESEELRRAMTGEGEEAVRREMGDLLFAAANVSRLLGVNPELALAEANRRFIKRVNRMEEGLRSEGLDLEGATLDQMEKIWESVKKDSQEG
jgi:MazG family protein